MENNPPRLPSKTKYKCASGASKRRKIKEHVKYVKANQGVLEAMLRKKIEKEETSKSDDDVSDDTISDIDGGDLFVELKQLRIVLPQKNMGSIEMLNYLKEMDGCYPNVLIAYRILLTIPVTVASAERSFSKLKLIKSYLRSTMSQDRLSGLATFSIERELVKELDYKNLISEFASRKANRVVLTK